MSATEVSDYDNILKYYFFNFIPFVCPEVILRFIGEAKAEEIEYFLISYLNNLEELDIQGTKEAQSIIDMVRNVSIECDWLPIYVYKHFRKVSKICMNHEEEYYIDGEFNHSSEKIILTLMQ